MNIKSLTFFKELIALPFIEQVILYGSRARSDALDRSDIDLAIVCPKASHKDWAQVITIIDNADTLLKIDCVRLDTLSDQNILRQNIKKEGIVLYEANQN